MQLVWVFHSVFGKVHCPWQTYIVSEYRWNLPVVLGICRTGGLTNLHLISSKESCCSFPQTNGLLFWLSHILALVISVALGKTCLQN